MHISASVTMHSIAASVLVLALLKSSVSAQAGILVADKDFTEIFEAIEAKIENNPHSRKLKALLLLLEMVDSHVEYCEGQDEFETKDYNDLMTGARHLSFLIKDRLTSGQTTKSTTHLDSAQIEEFIKSSAWTAMEEQEFPTCLTAAGAAVSAITTALIFPEIYGSEQKMVDNFTLTLENELELHPEINLTEEMSEIISEMGGESSKIAKSIFKSSIDHHVHQRVFQEHENINFNVSTATIDHIADYARRHNNREPHEQTITSYLAVLQMYLQMHHVRRAFLHLALSVYYYSDQPDYMVVAILEKIYEHEELNYDLLEFLEKPDLDQVHHAMGFWPNYHPILSGYARKAKIDPFITHRQLAKRGSGVISNTNENHKIGLVKRYGTDCTKDAGPTDRPGNDFKLVNDIKSLDACMALCRSTRACGAFTWKGPEAPKARRFDCFLKYGSPEINPENAKLNLNSVWSGLCPDEQDSMKILTSPIGDCYSFRATEDMSSVTIDSQKEPVGPYKLILDAKLGWRRKNANETLTKSSFRFLQTSGGSYVFAPLADPTLALYLDWNHEVKPVPDDFKPLLKKDGKELWTIKNCNATIVKE